MARLEMPIAVAEYRPFRHPSPAHLSIFSNKEKTNIELKLFIFNFSLNFSNLRLQLCFLNRQARFVFDEAIDLFLRQFDSLMLCPPGRAFVDIPVNFDDSGNAVKVETFCVREVMKSPVPRLFVVHLDVLDGSFSKRSSSPEASAPTSKGLISQRLA